MYFISDTHFLHDNIIKYCSRPENHNEIMMENWNKVVKKDDNIIHLGDFAVGVGGRDITPIVNFLNGEKTLISGNHDYKQEDFYMKLGFKKVLQYGVIEYKGYKILLSHYPLANGGDDVLVKTQKDEMRKLDFDFVFHGHIHNTNWDPRATMVGEYPHFNCSVEVIDYTPIHIDVMIKELESLKTKG